MPDFPGSHQDRHERHDAAMELLDRATENERFQVMDKFDPATPIFPVNFCALFSHTPEEWAKMLPFIQAYIEGKPVYTCVIRGHRHFWVKVGPRANFIGRPIMLSLNPPQVTEFLLPSTEAHPMKKNPGESPPSAS